MAAEDRILKILLQIQSDIGDLTKVTGGIKDLQKTTEDAAKSGFSLGDAFKFAGAGEALRRVIDYVKEIPMAIEDAIAAGVEFNSQMQQVQIGIAAALRQNMSDVYGSFDDAMKASGVVMDLLKQKANEFGLSYQQNFEAYQHSINAMLGGGVEGFDRQINLIITLNAAIKTLGLSASVTARDINDMLIGNASRTIAGRQLAAGMGFPNAEELDRAILQARALGQEYQFFMEHMKGFAEAIQAQANAFSAVIERMRNSALDFKAELATGMMQPLQQAAKDWGDVLKADEIKASARTWGQIFGEMTREVEQLTVELLKANETASKLGGGHSLGWFKTGVEAEPSPGSALFDQNVAAIQTEALNKQKDLMFEIVTHAALAEEKSAARAQLDTLIASIEKQIADGILKDADAARMVLGILVEWTRNWEGIAGTAEVARKKIAEITAEQQKLLDQFALYHAMTYGSEADVYSAKWTATYHTIAEEAKKAGQQINEQELNQLTYERLRGPERLADLRREGDAQQEVTEFTREQALALQQVRNAQELVKQNPFLSVEQKDMLSIPLIASEIQNLNIEIKKGEKLLDGGTLDPAQYDRVAAEVDNLKTRVTLLGYELKKLSFGGELKASLVQWVNSFGSAADQLTHVITGTLNTAIGSTSQALAGLIFQTGNWQQTFARAAESIVANLIKIALEFVVSRLVMAAINRVAGSADSSAANKQAQAAFASWEPAAVSASIATYGVASGAGLAAYLAAVASGEAAGGAITALGGAAGVAHEGAVIGGSEGSAPGLSREERIYKLLVGEGVFTEEQMAHMFVPPQATHKFSSDQLAALGMRRYHEGDWIEPGYLPGNIGRMPAEPHPTPGDWGSPMPPSFGEPTVEVPTDRTLPPDISPFTGQPGTGGPTVETPTMPSGEINLLRQLAPPGTTLVFDSGGQPYYFNAQTGEYTPTSQFVDASGVVPSGRMPSAGRSPAGPRSSPFTGEHPIYSGVTVHDFNPDLYGGAYGNLYTTPNAIMQGLIQSANWGALDWGGRGNIYAGGGEPFNTGFEHAHEILRARGLMASGPGQSYDQLVSFYTAMWSKQGIAIPPGVISPQDYIVKYPGWFDYKSPTLQYGPDYPNWKPGDPPPPQFATNFWQWHTANLLRHGITPTSGWGSGLFGHMAPSRKHSGGELAHDEVPLIGQIGEFVHQRSAVDHYGVDLMHALNERRIPMEHMRFHMGDLIGTPGAGSAHSSFATSSAPVVHNHALFFDRRAAREWLLDREGEKHIIDLVDRYRRNL